MSEHDPIEACGPPKVRNVTEGEIELIKAFVKSSAYSAFLTVMRNYQGKLWSDLLVAEDPNQVFRIQGEIRGLNTAMNLPGLITAREEERQVRREREAKTQKSRMVPADRRSQPRVDPAPRE